MAIIQKHQKIKNFLGEYSLFAVSIIFTLLMWDMVHDKKIKSSGRIRKFSYTDPILVFPGMIFALAVGA